MKNIIFIHGLESSGEGYKAKFLKGLFPEILTPTFFPYSSKFSLDEVFKERMQQLQNLLKYKANLIIIGSSFGGLMATIYTFKNPIQVKKLVLLAPFLTLPKYYNPIITPITIPVFVVHGIHDSVVSARKARKNAEYIFENLEYVLVDDDHFLYKTVGRINWNMLINDYPSEKKIIPSELIRQ